MSFKQLAVFVILAGIAMVAVGLLADPLGLGRYPGIGWKQIIVIVVGIVALGIGISSYRRAAGGRAQSSPTESSS